MVQSAFIISHKYTLEKRMLEYLPLFFLFQVSFYSFSSPKYELHLQLEESC